MLLRTDLVIKSYVSNQEIKNATIVNISVGGMHFFIPPDYPKLQLHEICTFIFDLPQFGKTCVLGEIHYLHDVSDHHQPTEDALHYRAKFINIPMQTWHHIKSYCQNVTETPPAEPAPKYTSTVQRTNSKTAPTSESLTTKTLALITSEILLESGLIIQGKVKDIDFEGLELLLPEPIPVNMNLSLNVSFEELHFEAKGICNWCEQNGQEAESFLTDISFNHIEQEQFNHLKSLMMKLATFMADWILKSHESLAER